MFLESICLDGGDLMETSDLGDVESANKEIYFLEQRHAYRSAIAIAVQNQLLGDPSKKGTRKTKWQGSGIFDEKMTAFLTLCGITTGSDGHFQDKAILLAEAGIDFMKLKLESGESLWPLILASNPNQESIE